MAPAAPGRPPHPALLTGRQAAPAPSSARRSQALHQPRDRTGLGHVVPTAPGTSPTTPSPPQPRSARGKRFGFLSSPRSAPRYPISAQPPSPASPGADQSTGAVRLCQSDRSRFGGGRGGKRESTPRAAPAPRPLTGRRLPNPLPPRSRLFLSHSPGRPTPRPPSPAPELSPARLAESGKEGEGGRPEQERAPSGRETRWRRLREAAGRRLRPFPPWAAALRRRMTRS